jgi:prolyl-tRNA synthetase
MIVYTAQQANLQCRRDAAGEQTGDTAEKRHEAGVSPKDVDFARWYSDVIIKGELLSYYNIPGLFVLRPSAFSMWEIIQKWFDERIKGVGVENCMFPLFIREDVLRKEEDHIDVRFLI